MSSTAFLATFSISPYLAAGTPWMTTVTIFFSTFQFLGVRNFPRRNCRGIQRNLSGKT